MRKFAHFSTAAAVAALAVLGGCSTGQHDVAPGTPTSAAAGGDRPPVSSSAHPTASPPAPAATSAPGTLNPVQLPGGTTLSWHARPAPQTHPVSGDMRLNECQTVHGATTWRQQVYASTADVPAAQDTFVFPNADAADSAYRSLVAGMDGCTTRSHELQAAAKLPTDAVLTPTGRTGAGAAWKRTWTGAGGISAAGAQTNHIYLVHRDTVITVLQITEFSNGTHAVDTSKDAAVLDALTSNLTH